MRCFKREFLALSKIKKYNTALFLLLVGSIPLNAVAAEWRYYGPIVGYTETNDACRNNAGFTSESAGVKRCEWRYIGTNWSAERLALYGYQPNTLAEAYSYCEVILDEGGTSIADRCYREDEGTSVYHVFIKSGVDACPSGNLPDINGNCQDGDPNLGSPECGAGNPISIATGNKFQSESDYLARGPLALSIRRFYNSASKTWLFSSQAKLSIGYGEIRYVRGDGKGISFIQKNGVWQAPSSPQLNLSQQADNTWHLVGSSRVTHVFDQNGRRQSTTDLQGNSVTYQYDANGKIQTIIHSNGQSLAYSYNAAGQVAAIQTATDGTFSYTYSNNMLIGVTHPDNTTRTYLYEDTDYPYALTGIIDERGKRFATWAYDAEGRAILSKHAGDVEETQLVFNADGSTTVTNSLNKSTTYRFTTINGAKKVIQVEGHASASCVAANENYTYSHNGQIESKADWQGNVTRYVYNARGLLIKKIKAEGSPDEQVIETEWHPTLDLPSKTIEAGRETLYEYDAEGRLIKQTTRPSATQ